MPKKDTDYEDMYEWLYYSEPPERAPKYVQCLGQHQIEDNPYLLQLSRCRLAGTKAGKFNKTYMLNLLTLTLTRVTRKAFTVGEIRAMTDAPTTYHKKNGETK